MLGLPACRIPHVGAAHGASLPARAAERARHGLRDIALGEGEARREGGDEPVVGVAEVRLERVAPELLALVEARCRKLDDVAARHALAGDGERDERPVRRGAAQLARELGGDDRHRDPGARQQPQLGGGPVALDRPQAGGLDRARSHRSAPDPDGAAQHHDAAVARCEPPRERGGRLGVAVGAVRRGRSRAGGSPRRACAPSA